MKYSGNVWFQGRGQFFSSLPSGELNSSLVLLKNLMPFLPHYPRLTGWILTVPLGKVAQTSFPLGAEFYFQSTSRVGNVCVRLHVESRACTGKGRWGRTSASFLFSIFFSGCGSHFVAGGPPSCEPSRPFTFRFVRGDAVLLFHLPLPPPPLAVVFVAKWRHHIWFATWIIVWEPLDPLSYLKSWRGLGGTKTSYLAPVISSLSFSLSSSLSHLYCVWAVNSKCFWNTLSWLMSLNRRTLFRGRFLFLRDGLENGTLISGCAGSWGI